MTKKKIRERRLEKIIRKNFYFEQVLHHDELEKLMREIPKDDHRMKR